MNTLEHLVSTLKQNPDLLAPLSHFVDTFHALRTSHTLEARGFAQAEHVLLDSMRTLSSHAHALLLSAWDAPAPDVMVHEGRCFTRTRRLPKTYQGLDGPLTLIRWVYHCSDSGVALCPLELRAGLVEGKLTPAAARLELMSSAGDDYRKAVALHRAAYVLGRSKSSLERDVITFGAQLEQHERELEQVRLDQLVPIQGIASFSVSVDRTGLPFEEPLPKKPGRPKKGAPKRPCEVVKRQVYCACVNAHDEKGNVLMTQRFAGLPTQGDRVVAQARACLAQMLTWAPKARLVQICDGADEMQRRGREILEGYEVTLELADAWHAASYILQACTSAGFPESYGKEMVRRLIENRTGVEENLIRLRTIAVDRRIKDVEDAIRYLSNKKHLMKYAEARKLGLAIGSGSVEATCKCVVAVRFKRSGARWKPEGASPLLAVRAWLTSDQDVWWPVSQAFLDTYVVRLTS